MSTELALYEHAREALAEAVSFDEVTQIKTRAEQAKAYARIARDRKLLADAQELIARAERKLGIMLRQVKEDGLLSQGGRPAENSNLNEPETGADAGPVFDATPFTLAELGISKKLSSRAQHLAELDEDVFEDSVAATREKILSTDAAVVSGPKLIKPPPAPKPEPTRPLPAEQFHRFVFSVLALSMASDRVSSEALHKLAEHCRIVDLDGETIDFTPEAYAALGTLADVALKALDGEQKSTEAAKGDQDDNGRQHFRQSDSEQHNAAPVSGLDGPGEGRDGGDQGQGPGVSGADRKSGSEPGIVDRADQDGRSGHVGGEAHHRVETASPAPALPIAEADALIRAALAAETPPAYAALAEQVGRPGDLTFIKNRVRAMGLSSRDRQRAAVAAANQRRVAP